jgi:hypothetical protein
MKGLGPPKRFAFNSQAQLILAFVLATQVVVANGQKPRPDAPFIEVTNVMQGVGGVHQQLWVRINKNGGLEWEEPVEGKPNELRSAQLDPKQFERFHQLLDSTDWTKFSGRIGPYFVYKDSGVELRYRVVVAQVERRFSLDNPWPPGTREKSLPSNVKKLLCELALLRSQATGDPINRTCLQGNVQASR